MNNLVSKTLLVVDDEALIIKILTSVLRDTGYDIIGFTDPRQAWNVYQANGSTYDLVITDVLMPNMTGRQLAEKIWSLKPDQKVLFMSGQTKGVITQRDLQANGWTLLAKPFSRVEILSAVQSVLDS